MTAVLKAFKCDLVFGKGLQRVNWSAHRRVSQTLHFAWPVLREKLRGDEVVVAIVPVFGSGVRKRLISELLTLPLPKFSYLISCSPIHHAIFSFWNSPSLHGSVRNLHWNGLKGTIFFICAAFSYQLMLFSYHYFSTVNLGIVIEVSNGKISIVDASSEIRSVRCNWNTFALCRKGDKKGEGSFKIGGIR